MSDAVPASRDRGGKAIAGLLLWLVLVGSKFLILELVDLVFGSRVSLDGFIPVMLLVITLLLARAGVRRLLKAAPMPVRPIKVAHDGNGTEPEV